jgi:hypothetical protein
LREQKRKIPAAQRDKKQTIAYHAYLWMILLLKKLHDAQVLTYLRLFQRKRGLLLNFNVPTLKAGIKRLSL